MKCNTLDARPTMGTSGVTFLQERVRSGLRSVQARIAYQFPFSTGKARLGRRGAEMSTSATSEDTTCAGKGNLPGSYAERAGPKRC